MQFVNARRATSSLFERLALTLGERMKLGTGVKVRSLAISTLRIGFWLGTIFVPAFLGDSSIAGDGAAIVYRNAVSLIQVNIASAERSLPFGLLPYEANTRRIWLQK